VEGNISGKHSSLLQNGNNYRNKKFYCIGPVSDKVDILVTILIILNQLFLNWHHQNIGGQW
jgi:hypothetical protein